MEIAVADLLKILKKRWLLIFLLVVIATISVGLISYLVLKPQYQATSSLLINHDNQDTQASYDAMISNDKLLATYNQFITSREVENKVIADLHLKLTASTLSHQVAVSADNNSLITTITVTAGDPRLAAQIANAMATTAMDDLNQVMGTRIFVPLDAADVNGPPDKVAPRPTFNMAVAFVLAFVIGAGLAFALEFMDKTLQTEEQVEAVLGLPVLGAIPTVKQEVYIEEAKDSRLVGGVVHDN